MAGTTGAIDAVILASTAGGVAGVPHWVRREARTPPSPAGRRFSPAAGLACVVAAVYLNQLLVTIYLIRDHGGDPGFIARYLPPGWFALADHNAALRALAAHTPAPWLLAPSLLRVQAFLELPFVLLAFLTVLRWLDRDWYRRLAASPALWLASASYTAVFCLVEWQLRNPYTTQDLACRLASAVLTPLALRALARRGPASSDPPPRPVPIDSLRLLLFTASLALLGHLILVVYDTALLYNLGHLGAQLPGAAASLAALLIVRLAADRLPSERPPGPAVSALADTLRWSLALFFLPALPIRYGVTFGTPLLAAACGLLVGLAAAVLALHRRPYGIVLPRLAPAVLLGACASYATTRHMAASGMYETTLLFSASCFLGCCIVAAAVADRVPPAIPAR